MSINFPAPYQDELLYSTVARYGVHHGILSPKELLEEVFGERNLTPTYDFPTYIEHLAGYLPAEYDAVKLIHHHTLLPAYIPFQPADVIHQAMAAMRASKYSPLHTKLGKNASRIKSPDFFRFCPECWRAQLAQYGEVYWKRVWQLTGYEYCTLHQQPLYLSRSSCKGTNRKFYYAPLTARNYASPVSLDSECLQQHHQLAQQIEELFTTPVTYTIENFSKISDAYFRLLKDKDLLQGKQHIDFKKIRQKVLDYWGEKFLAYYGLADLISESCWLKNIFRKHRKAFSYLEHIIVLRALDPTEQPVQLLQKYLAQKDTVQLGLSTNQVQLKNHIADAALSADQQHWLSLIKTRSAKQARQHNPPLYARLYRNNKDWLLLQNQSALPALLIPRKSRVDWATRDRQFVKQLIKIRNALLEDLDSPQWTKKYFIKQLLQISTIENNLSALPLTAAFLQRYAESTSCYQIRRMTRVHIRQHITKTTYTPSVFLRLAGLSPQRITPEAAHFFHKILGY